MIPLIEEQAEQHLAEEHGETLPFRDPPVSTPTFPVFGARSVESREPLSHDQRDGAHPYIRPCTTSCADSR